MLLPNLNSTSAPPASKAVMKILLLLMLMPMFGYAQVDTNNTKRELQPYKAKVTSDTTITMFEIQGLGETFGKSVSVRVLFIDALGNKDDTKDITLTGSDYDKYRNDYKYLNKYVKQKYKLNYK